MKKCLNCENLCADDAAVFCPFCGSAFPRTQDNGTAYEAVRDDPMAGYTYGTQSAQQPQQVTTGDAARMLKDAAVNVTQRVRNSSFVQAVHSDLQNSAAIQSVKESVSGAANKAMGGVSNGAAGANKRTLAIVATVIVVIGLTLGLGLHRCDICKDVFFGKQHKISYQSKSVKMCDDCYDKLKIFDISNWLS